MIDDRLDDLLARAREPDPPDGGFTASVMARVREEGHRAPPGIVLALRRFVGRPAVLAAAALLATGGALAAVRTVVPAQRPAQTAAPFVDNGSAAVEVTAAPATARADREDRPAAGGEATAKPTARPAYPGFEGGYTSEHGSYAVDRGLRLELETYANEARAGAANRMTLTLRNGTGRRIELYGPKGCLLGVAGQRKDHREGEDDAGVWACAPGSKDPRPRESTSTQEPERVALADGQSYVVDANVSFPQAGEWTVGGVCACFEQTAAKSPAPQKPTPSPAVVVPQLTSGPQTRPAPATTDSSRESRRLLTPPITVRVD